MNLEVYGKEGCPGCQAIKPLMEKMLKLGLADTISYIDYQKQGYSIDDLRKRYNANIDRVPVVVIDGQYIGSYSALKERYPL